MKPDCSIVIRAYNEEAHLKRLLTGIMEQTIRNVQIILVDSGSTDDTLRIVSHYPVEVVQIRPQDFTFGYSLNQGLARAQAEFTVIPSAHVYPVYPDWLEKMLEPFQNERVALTYGKQRGTEASKFSEQQYFRQLYPEHAAAHQKHPFCNNANAAVRMSLWKQHSYDETLSGLEDMAWALWAQDNHFDIVYVPDAEIIHIHNETWDGVYNRFRREAMAFKNIFPQEYFGWKEMLYLFSSNFINDLMAASKQRKLWACGRSIFRFRWAQFWGTFQGYRQSGSLTWELRQTYYYPRSSVHSENTNQQPERQPISYADLKIAPSDKAEDQK